MRIIVCGSREWADSMAVNMELDGYHDCPQLEPLVIVHGDCPTGADRHAHEWCHRWGAYGVREEPYPAHWKGLGRAAGPRRNQLMADLGADLCIAFWDGESRGTLDMITRAAKAGIPVRIVPAPK